MHSLMPGRHCLRQLTALLCVWMVVAASPVTAADAWYRVQDGDSLASIAEDFGVTGAAIIQYNGIARQSPIVRGQILRIPLPDPTLVPESSTASADSVGTHIVRAGESLQLIGQRYGLDWQRLAQANGIINPNLIYVGQVLLVPAETDTIVAPVVVPTPQPIVAQAPVASATERGRYPIYVTQFGDTLNRIAQDFGITVGELLSLNKFRSDTRLIVGDVVLIPQSASLSSTRASISADVDAASRHVVSAGDTLADIAARYGRSVLEIAAANGLLDLNRIYVGQVLIIP